MKSDFWHKRWSEGRIGFHQEQVNSYLAAHWKKLDLEPNTPVFVPLCGKSQDMIWLANQGHPVVGVELSRAAIEAFDQENQLSGSWSEMEGAALYCADNIQIWHSDLFALDSRHIQPIRAIYDRAALIALPAAMRKIYSQHINNLIDTQCQQLLICLEYDQNLREGPPFSILKEEVSALYSNWNIERLATNPIEGKQPASADSSYRLTIETV